MQENNSIIIAMLEELLTISKNQRTQQTVNADVDLTPIKELIENGNKHREQAESDLQKVVAIMSGDVEMIHCRVKNVRAIIGNSQPSGKLQESVDETKTLVQKLKETIEDGVHKFKHHRIGFETPFVCWTIVIETVLILGLFTWIIISEKPNQDRINNDLKYRYIKMKGDASAEQIATLEEIFELNRDNQKIEQMRDDVETYEEAVRKQAALAEQARLKEQAAKEQESKAKSIKDKQQQPKDNPKQEIKTVSLWQVLR